VSLQPVGDFTGADGNSVDAYAYGEAPAVGLVSLAASVVTADSTAAVTATADAGASLTAGGAVTIKATGIDSAYAKGDGFSLSLFGFGLIDASSNANGSDSASVGAGAAIKAGSLDVEADGTDYGPAMDESTNISGLGSYSVSTSTSTAPPAIRSRCSVTSRCWRPGRPRVMRIRTQRPAVSASPAARSPARLT